MPLFGEILRGEIQERGGYVMPTSGRSELIPLHLNENLFEVEGALPPLPTDRPTLSRYPVGGSRPLVQALADHYGLEPAAIFVNAGACGVLNVVFSLCANAGAVAVMPSPTWSYYHDVLGGLGVRRVDVPQRLGPDGYAYDVDAIAERAVGCGATLVVLTSPNNPTGNRVGYAEVRALAQRCAGSLIVLDEAYFGFAPPDPMPVATLVGDCPNVVVVRTFSKALGLAFLRVGFALAGEQARILLRRLPVPFGLAGYAQELAIARLRDRAYLAAVRQACQRARETLHAGLHDLPGFFVHPSAANFVLVRTPPGRARAIRDHLADHGFLVKLGDSAEMPDHLRITLADVPIMDRVASLVCQFQRRPEGAPMPIQVKLAETEAEYTQIHAINLQVYALELGQDRAPEGAEQLVDPRLDKTTYIIAKDGEKVVGMLGLTPPGVRFSLEDSLAGDGVPAEDRAEAIEIRRLALLPDYRGRRIFPRILLFLQDYAAPRRYRIGYISAIEGRVPDYLRMGFRSFGQPFIKGAVRYQPMRLHIADFRIPPIEGDPAAG
ncbi:MAG: aminotransferase class I/II-fold pyridoxal phosphate-dependent enzyme [Pseudomonadota bacterium]